MEDWQSGRLQVFAKHQTAERWSTGSNPVFSSSLWLKQLTQLLNTFMENTMNVNEKGNIGLIKVMSDLYSKGYHCFTPFDDHSPIDLVAMDKQGNIKRLQVKYRSLNLKRQYYELYARSVVNGKPIPVDRNLIDSWAVYLADEDTIVYVPVGMMEGKSVHYIKPGNLEKYGMVP